MCCLHQLPFLLQGPARFKDLSVSAGIFKKAKGKSAAPDTPQDAAEADAGANAVNGQVNGQVRPQGVCGMLGEGRVYVGSSCMVDACSAMYQQIGIQVKWGEQASSFIDCAKLA